MCQLILTISKFILCRILSTEKMQTIISYIDQYFCDKHTSPSVNEIALGVGIPKTTVFRYLVEMDNRGMIEYDGKSRTIRTAIKIKCFLHRKGMTIAFLEIACSLYLYFPIF